ncbi:MAG TPA: hypothetical protein VK589_27310 [Chryseolinea sp.]|nr:hypothetical protein [Chryseolinea sp.]
MFFLFTLLLAGSAYSQSPSSSEEKWGIVLEHPLMKDVVVSRNVEYYQRNEKRLQLDIYTLPRQTGINPRGAVVFLTEMNKDRSWKIYQTWPRLAAAFGLIGIVVQIDKDDYLESAKEVFKFISSHGKQYQIDTSKVGVYIPSHVPLNVMNYLIKDKTNPCVKSVVMFCSNHAITGPFKKDLPVMYVTDDQIAYPNDLFSSLWTEVQKSKAPWTLRFGTGMPIFFESFADNDEARKIIREAIYFFKNHLEPLPPSDGVAAEDRAMIATLYRADYGRAAPLFKEWLDRYPNDQYALLKYAMISFIQKDYVEAEAAYKKVNDLDPVYRIDLMKTLLANSKAAEAEIELTRALRSGMVKRSPYPGIALFLYSLGRFSQGVSYYQMASEKDLRGEDHYNMARGYSRMNEMEKAFNELEKALQNNFGTREQIENEKDFEQMKSLEKYKEILERLQ